MAAWTTRILAFLIAGAAGTVVRPLYTRLGRFEISESSMMPNLHPGDFVFVDRSRRPAYRGDIAVFEHPHRPAFFLVKRVIGLPGEHLMIENGQVLVDGTPLSEPWTADDTGPDGSWELAPEEAFVLGDARQLSSGDSRELGPLPVEHLRLKVVFRYWPPQRFGPVP